MSEKSLDEILDAFDPACSVKRGELKDGDQVTMRLPKGYGEKWEKLQNVSKLQWGKTARQVLINAIDRAYSKVS
jgi:hypothetical protein